MRRRLSLVLLAALFLPAGCTAQPDEPDVAAYLSGTVQIGTSAVGPGWSFYGNDGVWSGFDIALGNWLGQRIGFTPQYVPVAADERITKLEDAAKASPPQAAGIKLIISSFSITPARRERVDFAGPYFIDAQGVMTRAGSKVDTLDQVAGLRVCVTNGTTNEQRLGDEREGVSVIRMVETTTNRCVQRLLAKQVDAVSSDIGILEGFAHHHRGKLRVTPIRFGSERYGIGLPNNRPELCQTLNKHLVVFINEVWEQKLREALPTLPQAGRKPNSGGLPTCEPAGDGGRAAPPIVGLGPGPGSPVVRHRSRSRRARRG